ncbi:hypothetical protein RchiOBHm_Chr5g0050511 [Rosa chinensis]|uniref:Uncharacterized protein n=1 Tax=Rosa chinensis TaxID=74649 RepID=A0A2P6QF49_ROSCH|nr:hypothetical protein RchiOBHm_Chr5g0050511 [Rosa chinensis]
MPNPRSMWFWDFDVVFLFYHYLTSVLLGQEFSFRGFQKIHTRDSFFYDTWQVLRLAFPLSFHQL